MEVLGDLGHPATQDDVAACTGLGFLPTWKALNSLGPLPAADRLWPDLLATLENSFANGLRVFDDAVGVLESCLSAGIPVAVVSASPRSRLRLTLEAAGLDGRFAVSVAGDDVERGKPAPDPYLAAATGLGVTPSVCVAIEDSVAGAAAATAAGMGVVAVVRDERSRRDLLATGAAVVGELTPEVIGLRVTGNG